jgi:hypothetical protein
MVAAGGIDLSVNNSEAAALIKINWYPRGECDV